MRCRSKTISAQVVTWLSPDTKCGKTGIIVGISSPIRNIKYGTQHTSDTTLTFKTEDGEQVHLPDPPKDPHHTHEKKRSRAMRCNCYLTDRNVKRRKHFTAQQIVRYSIVLQGACTQSQDTMIYGIQLGSPRHRSSCYNVKVRTGCDEAVCLLFSLSCVALAVPFGTQAHPWQSLRQHLARGRGQGWHLPPSPPGDSHHLSAAAVWASTEAA
jgi:hypothetical protein